MRFTGGLNKDVDPSAQPEGTYRHLENGVLNDRTGSIVSERGINIEEADLENIYSTLTVPQRDTIFFFGDDGSGNNFIKQYNYDFAVQAITTIDDSQINVGSLGFPSGSQIDTEYSINNSGELIIYWTDGANPPRFYNVDKNKDIENVNELNVFPHYNTSLNQNTIDFSSTVKDSGGSLSGGSYQLAFAYLDQDQTLTNYFFVSNPINIFRDGLDPVGIKDDDNTSKAIKFTLNNLDTSFERLRVTSIKGTQVANVADLTINNSSITYTYTGNEDETVGSLDEVVIDQPSYDRVNTIKEYDNQLYMGGVKRGGLNESQKEELQKVALNVEVDNTLDTGNDIQDEGRNTTGIGFKRGEVYAFYISFLRTDGRETEAFHIPGRPATIGNERNSYSNSGVTADNRYEILAEPDSTHNMGYWENQDEQYPNKEPFTSTDFTENSGTKTYDGTPIRHHRMPGPTYLSNRPTNINDTGIAFRESNLCYVTFKNINLPSSLAGEVNGYKIYYAKRDDNDKLIVDQAAFGNGWLDRDTGQTEGNLGYRSFQNGDEVFKQQVYCTHGFDELHEHDASGNQFETETWGSDQSVLYSRPAYSLINRPELSGVSHLRGIESIEYEHQPVSPSKYLLHNGNEQRTIITGPHEGTEDGDWIREVKNSPVYINKNQRSVDITEFGFNYKFDNLFGESKVVLEITGTTDRGQRVIFDMCQQLQNVYEPYDNQELVDTGASGYIDGAGSGETITAKGGDTFVTKNTYKANTLLALPNDSDDPWNDAFDQYWIKDISDALPVSGTTEREGVRKGIQEEIGTKGSINITPFPVGHSYDSYIESRIPATLVSDGDDIYSRRAPRIGGVNSVDWRVIPDVEELEPSINRFDTSNSPPAKQVIIAKQWSRFFIRSDNYPEWNEEYGNVNNTKPNFAWDPFDIVDKDNYNRIIRSSGSNKPTGRSESFRRFLEEDFFDVKENRGEIKNLEEFNDNLLIHLDRTLIQTRGRQTLQSEGGQEVFVGSGNVFKVPPENFQATELGFAGLHSLDAQVKCEAGYFWVDKDARSIYHLSSQGLNELTTEQFGLSEYLDNLLRNGTTPKVGYGTDDGKVMFTFFNPDETLSYYPDRQVWGSFHNYYPDVYVDYLDTLAFVDDNDLKFLNKEISNTKFTITFAVPHGVGHKANSVWFNADKFDSNNNLTEEIPFTHITVENENQTTSRTEMTDYDGNTPSDITNRGNTRRVQGVWRFNEIRENDSSLSYLPDWAREKRLEDDYHLVTLEADHNNDYEIQLSAAGLTSEQTAH